MTKLNVRLVLSLGLTVVLAATGACRSSSGDDTNADGGHVIDGGGNGDGSIGGTTIKDIQNGTIATGSMVNLTGVIVTAIDTYGARIGGVYVQDLGGGEYSGVFVYNPSGADTVQPGDIVNITGGQVQEFAITGDVSGNTLTEIGKAMGGTLTIAKTGTGMLPTPSVVDPVALVADPTETEKWEGVPVTFQNVSVVSTFSQIGSTDPTFRKTRVSGPFQVESSLTALPEADMPIDTCLGSITGIIDYAFDYSLLPRSAADIVLTGGTCILENTIALCEDGIDNDHDGFTDCNDNGCKLVDPSCTSATSVVAIQNGTVPANQAVDLTNVVITAIGPDSFAGSGVAQLKVWVADSATAAPYNGIEVFKPTLAAGLTVDMLHVGDVVSVTGGVVKEFKQDATQTSTLTELSVPGGGTMTLSKVSDAAGAPVALATTPAAIIADGEQFEGVLINVGILKVSAVAAGTGNFLVADPNDATQSLLVRNTIVAPPAGIAVGLCYALVGVLDYGKVAGQPDPPGEAYRLINTAIGAAVTCP